ncbi:MAG: CHY zinc finger protein [Terracidiphilus sp.]
MFIPRPLVLGIDLDTQTRCVHYHSALDIIAIKMNCCGAYFACKECHNALADHVIEVWPRSEWDQPAVLCGVCGAELSIRQYLGCVNTCPSCRSQFNPGCQNHYHYYFESEATAG